MPSLRDTQPASAQVLYHAFVLLLVTVAGLTDSLLYQHSKELLAVYITGDTSKLAQSLQQGDVAKALPLLGIIFAFLSAPRLPPGLATGLLADGHPFCWRWSRCSFCRLACRRA